MKKIFALLALLAFVDVCSAKMVIVWDFREGPDFFSYS